MRFSRLGWSAAAMAVTCAAGTVWTVPAAATAAPQAELSIDSGPSLLAVTFEAASQGFPAPVTSYIFSFGDHTNKVKTPHPTTVHTYTVAGKYTTEVKEIDSLGDTATAVLLLDVGATCPAGSSCSQTETADGVTIKVSGSALATKPAEIKLAVGPFRIGTCDPAKENDGTATDSGFAGPLTLKVVYTVPLAASGDITCFQSLVPFFNTAKVKVKKGMLPMCSGSPPTPPCVVSISPKGANPGTVVTKVLLIPPGDPKVGSL